MTPADVELAERYVAEVNRLRILSEAYGDEVDRLAGIIAEVVADLETWLPSRSSKRVLEKLRAALDE